MEKKRYQKPMIEKVNLRITEAVLTACKTALKALQPSATTRTATCTAGGINACRDAPGS
jgi:hypothetical protein